MYLRFIWSFVWYCENHFGLTHLLCQKHGVRETMRKEPFLRRINCWPVFVREYIHYKTWWSSYLFLWSLALSACRRTLTAKHPPCICLGANTHSLMNPCISSFFETNECSFCVSRVHSYSRYVHALFLLGAVHSHQRTGNLCTWDTEDLYFRLLLRSSLPHSASCLFVGWIHDEIIENELQTYII